MPDLNLEEISFRNLVLYYLEDLRAIRDGARIRTVFTCTQSRTLLKHGVYSWLGGRRGILLSDQVVAILEGAP